MNMSKLKQLIDQAHDPTKQSAIVAEIATVTSEEGGLFLNGLLSRGEREPALKIVLTLLAAACLPQMKGVAASIKKNVQQHVGKIVPPRKEAQAQELATAGDLAVFPIERYLARRGKDLDKPCAYCVRTLALIGSQAALAVLEMYAHALCPAHPTSYGASYAGGGMVYSELLRAWPHFHREEYRQRVLDQYLRTAETLLLGGSHGLEGMPALPALRRVEWWGCSKLGDLSPLAASPHLQEVFLNACFGLRDVKALSVLPTLKQLTLYRMEPHKIKGLTALKSLDHLSVTSDGGGDDNGQKNLESIAQVTGLRELSLVGYWSRLSEISALAPLTKLQKLTIYQYGELKDLAVLSRLPELKHLSLAGGIQLRGLSEFTGQIEQLELSECQLLDLTGIAGLTGLRKLVVRDSPHLGEVRGLAALVNLETLELTGRETNQLRDIGPLGSLTNLRILDLEQGAERLSDYEPSYWAGK